MSPSNFKLCALRDRDNDEPNFDAAFLSSSRAAERFRSSTSSSTSSSAKIK